MIQVINRWELCTFARRWHCIHLVGSFVLLPRDGTAYICWNFVFLLRDGTAYIWLGALHFLKSWHCTHLVGSFALLPRESTAYISLGALYFWQEMALCTYITFIWKLWTFVKRWHCTHLVGNCVLLPRDSTAFIKLEALHFCQEMALHTFSWELYTFLIFPRDGTAYFGWDLWTFAKRWHCKHLVRSFAISQELPLHTFRWELCTLAKRWHCIFGGAGAAFTMCIINIDIVSGMFIGLDQPGFGVL